MAIELHLTPLGRGKGRAGHMPEQEGREDDSDGSFDVSDGFGAGWWVLSAPLFWLLLIVGIVFLIRSRGGRPPWTGGGRETGIDVLERHFAEGELSLEQYRKRRAVLEEKR